MRTVHKFTVPAIGEVFDIVAGETLKPLTIRVQNGLFQIWVEVETSEEQLTKHPCILVGTGHPIPEGFDWIDTVQDGPLVWHLYVAL